MNKSVTIKAAYILGILGIIGVLIQVFFSNDKKSETVHNETRTEQVQKDEGSVFIGQSEVEQHGDKSMIFQGTIEDLTITFQQPAPTFATAASPTTIATELLEEKLKDQGENIKLNRDDIEKLAKALKDLDQRTSEIKRLPDGRTNLGGIITGEPSIVIENHNYAAELLRKNDFSNVFQFSKHAIEAYESCQQVLSSLGKKLDMSSNLEMSSIAKLYYIGAYSAHKLKKYTIALQWAKKANTAESNPQRLYLLGLTMLSVNEPNKALDIINEGLTKYPDNQYLTSLKQKITRESNIP